MITFIASIVALLLGYWLYGSFVEKVFGTDPGRQTPAFTKQDGVDYIPMKANKIYLIQFLNIAGLGPIFGAIAGAMWGPVAFLWIVLGSIFAGAVHDFMSGMISLRMNGESIPEVVGKMLGNSIKQFMRVFTVILLILVGAVFIMGPAGILNNNTSDWLGGLLHVSAENMPDFRTTTGFFWVAVILVYYIIATLLPVDKIIGKIYPLFGAALLFMAAGISIMLFVNGGDIPELSLRNMHSKELPIFPMLFITIACGAISGFHSTQSPLMARCLKNEKYGRPVFYGAMISEGIVALIWAAAAMSFRGGVEQLNEWMSMDGNTAAIAVDVISKQYLGIIGAFFAMLGVVAAPISTGDTAFRSARLIIADFLRLNQSPIKNRLLISVPLFLIGFILTFVPFDMVWRYFAWANQTLAMIVLWAISVYLLREDKNYWITLIPAVFMTAVTITYIMVAPEGLTLYYPIGLTIGIATAIAFMILFFVKKKQ